MIFEKCTKGEETDYEAEFDWYKTQLYPGASGECGPTVVSMVIGWAKQEDVHQSVIRDMLGYRFADIPDLKGSTTYAELRDALKAYDVDARIKTVSDVQEIIDMLDEGRVVIIGQTMSHITMVEGNWKENRVGRHHNYERGHYVILKGLEPEDESEYFVVYDPLSNPALKYDNGDLVGKDRLYPVEEVWEAIEERGYVIDVRKET